MLRQSVLQCTVNIRLYALQLYGTLPYNWEDRDRRYSRTRSEYYRIVTRHTVRLRGIELPGLRRYGEGARTGARSRGPTVVAPIDVDPVVVATTIVVALLLPPPSSSRRCRPHNLCAGAPAPTSIGRTDVCRQRRILECEVQLWHVELAVWYLSCFLDYFSTVLRRLAAWSVPMRILVCRRVHCSVALCLSNGSWFRGLGFQRPPFACLC